MTDNLTAVFRRNLKDAIKASPDSVGTIAARAGYSANYVSRIINQRRHNPTLMFVECVCEALGVSPLDMLRGEK